MERRWSKGIIEAIATGAIIGVLTAVTAHMLGVQQMIRIPDIALYFPAAVAGGAIGATRLRPLLWIAATPLAVVALLVAYTPLVRLAGGEFIRRDPLGTRVDAVVVLGTGITPDGLMRSETLDRLLSGVQLTVSGAAATMIISREERKFGGKVVSDSADQNALLTLVTPPAAVIFNDSVTSTRTEALRAFEIARARGIKTVAVVTSPLHTRRACATFEAVGFRVVCVPAALRQSGLDAESNTEDRMRGFRALLYEVFATPTYKSRGWIR